MSINEINSQHWEKIFNESPIGIALIDKNAKYIKVNSKVQEITGYSESELIGISIFNITHPSDQLPEEQMFKKLISGEIKSFEMIKRYVTKNLKVLWVRVNMGSITGENGEILYFIKHIQPIINGEKLNLENLHKKTERIDVMEFLSRWKVIVGIAVTIISFAIPVGVNLYRVNDNINDIQKNQDQLIQIIKNLSSQDE